MPRVEDLVRLRRADQLVAEIAARIADGRDLRVLAERVVELPVARDDLALDASALEQRLAGERVHAGDEIGEVVLDDEVLALLLERLDRPGRLVADGALGDEPPALARQVGVLLGAREREFLADDALVQHEPGVVVARCA